MKTIIGYDGIDIKQNDRVELHPATDLWMQGARFGTVLSIGRKYVTIKLDRLNGKTRINASNLRAVL